MKFIVFVIIVITCNGIVAQTITMKLWNGKAPGTPVNNGLANKEFHDKNYYTYNVSEPEVDVYLPPKEKANGSGGSRLSRRCILFFSNGA